jgi:hypothetical protein
VRTWRTPEGHILVEGPPASATFYLLDPAGTVLGCYEDHESSLEYDLYRTTHRVAGDALVAHLSIRRAVPDFDETHEERVKLAGLVAVPAESALGSDAAGVVERAVAAYRQREHEWRKRLHRPVVEAQASFAAALDGYASAAADGRVDLVFGYDDGPVVRAPDGTVVWRPTDRPPLRGKDLHYFLHGVLRERYGDRLGSLRTDLADAPWWFWAPDE